MKKIIWFLIFSCAHSAIAQLDTSKSNVNVSGYAELYYSYDFNQPSDHNRPGFFYGHNRHNEFNLNLGFLKANYSSDRTRANFALASGTYMNSNYSSEPGVLKNIYEANAGIKLSKQQNLWLDAGIFASHIGFESAVSKDCWNLTRSILAESTPFYESGVKISYTSRNNKWFISGLVLNGWQHIQRPDGVNNPSFGTQFTFTPNSDITINYSTFIGSEKPDSVSQMRYFNNLYAVINISSVWHVTAGFDYGMEQSKTGSSEYNNWYSPVLIVKADINNIWAVAGRAEYYNDENGVIINTGTPNGFQTSGFSVNADCKVRENMLWRIEARTLNSKDKIFIKNDTPENSNTFVTTSLAISF